MGFNQNKLLIMLLKCKQISPPYNGPYTDELITTYYLQDSQGNVYCWHEGPNKPLGCKVGDILDGIVIQKYTKKSYKKNVINYKKSNPVIINVQTLLDI